MNLRVNLCKVNAKSELGRQNLFETKCVQKDGDADRSSIQQKETTDKSHVFFCLLVQEDKKVDVKSQKVFGPKVKDFDHQCPNSVKEFIFRRSSSHATTSIGELRKWKPSSNENVRKENERILQNLSSKMLHHILSNQVIVHARTRNGQQSKVHVFVDKYSRQDSFIRVIACVCQLGENLEREVSRCSLDDTLLGNQVSEGNPARVYAGK
jgi:hypothetical protein